MQARQAFVYARAQGWQGPAREAALHAMRWFRAHYLRALELQPDYAFAHANFSKSGSPERARDSLVTRLVAPPVHGAQRGDFP